MLPVRALRAAKTPCNLREKRQREREREKGKKGQGREEAATPQEMTSQHAHTHDYSEKPRGLLLAEQIGQRATATAAGFENTMNCTSDSSKLVFRFSS